MGSRFLFLTTYLLFHVITGKVCGVSLLQNYEKDKVIAYVEEMFHVKIE